MKLKTFTLRTNLLSKLLLSLALLFIGGINVSADEITVYKGGEGGATNSSTNIPVYGNSVKTFLTESEFIIEKDSLSALAGKEITKLTFYLKTPASNSWTSASFNVYLEEISATNYPTSGTVFKRTTNFPYYTGALDATGSTMEIYLDVPFAYSGDNHLLIAVEQTVKSANNSSATFYTGVGDYKNNRGAYKTNGGMSFHLRGPKVTLTYSEASIGTITAPSAPVMSNETATSAVLSWTEGSDESVWQVSYSTASGDHSTTTSLLSNKSYTLSGLEPNTTYYVSVRAKKGTSYSNWSTESSFSTDGEVAVTSVSVTPTSWTMLAGDTKALTMEVTPADATDKTVTWESNNTSVATVSSEGVVTAVASGEATITVKSTADPTKQATCTITVSAPVTPTAYKVQEISKDYAYMTWTNGSTEDTWQIKYGTTSGSYDKLSGDVTTKPYLIVGLASNTTYYASIRSKLGTAYSAWSDEFSFTTPALGPAPAGAANEVEDFESGWPLSYGYLSGVKEGWGYVNGCGNYKTNDTYKHGDSGKSLLVSATTDHTNYIITPEIAAASEITFWSCRGSASGTGYIRLYKAIKVGNTFYVDTSVNYKYLSQTTNVMTEQSSTITEGGYVAIHLKNAAIDDFSYKAAPTATVITDNYGYATFASSKKLDLTAANLPDGLLAYKAKVDGSTVKFALLNQNVPENTGVLLEGAAYTEYKIAVASESTTVDNNDFIVNEGGATFSKDPDYTYYALRKNINPLAFATFNPSTVAIPSNKAYLKVENEYAVKGLSFEFDSPTAVQSIKEAQPAVKGAVYDLSGRRVASAANAQLPKGLYIIDGKKVVIN